MAGPAGLVAPRRLFAGGSAAGGRCAARFLGGCTRVGMAGPGWGVMRMMRWHGGGVGAVLLLLGTTPR